LSHAEQIANAKQPTKDFIFAANTFAHLPVIVCAALPDIMPELQRAQEIMVDGVFECLSAENGATSQLVTIMGRNPKNNNRFDRVLCEIVLFGKTEDTYTAAFHALRHGAQMNSVRTVYVNYEQGLVNALKATFPDVTVYGCVWHAIRVIEKKVKAQVGKQRSPEIMKDVHYLLFDVPSITSFNSQVRVHIGSWTANFSSDLVLYLKRWLTGPTAESTAAATTPSEPQETSSWKRGPKIVCDRHSSTRKATCKRPKSKA
jgi:hypothetical protein